VLDGEDDCKEYQPNSRTIQHETYVRPSQEVGADDVVLVRIECFAGADERVALPTKLTSASVTRVYLIISNHTISPKQVLTSATRRFVPSSSCLAPYVW
jgi:hypothetical protein